MHKVEGGTPPLEIGMPIREGRRLSKVVSNHGKSVVVAAGGRARDEYFLVLHSKSTGLDWRV